MVGRSAGRPAGRSTAQPVLAGRPAGRPAGQPVGRPVGKPVGWSADRWVGGRPVCPACLSVGRSIGRQIGRPAGRSVGWPVGRPVDRSAGRPIGWSVGQRLRRAVGRLAGRANWKNSKGMRDIPTPSGAFVKYSPQVSHDTKHRNESPASTLSRRLDQSLQTHAFQNRFTSGESVWKFNCKRFM